MSTQNFQNHVRYYAPHHFVLLPLLFISLGYGIYRSFTENENQVAWILFSVSIFFILYTVLMLRQHYALGNQNRIVRLEFRLRYFQLMGKKSDEVEQQLSFGQIAALRFASDAEFGPLLQRALQENLSPTEIKKAIKNWQADDMRV